MDIHELFGCPSKFNLHIKGEQQKTRPHETLANADFKVIYRQHQCIFEEKNLELISNAFFMDVEKKL